MKYGRAAMENFSEDGFESCEQFADWSTCSSEHWDENHRDGTGFGDWTSFKDAFSEESDSANVSSQKGQTCIHADKNIELPHPRLKKLEIPSAALIQTKMVRDTGMNILPLSQLLHNSSHTPPMEAVQLQKGANFYHQLLKPNSIMGSKLNLHSHKQLTDTLQLKQSNTLQNTELPHLGSEKPKSPSADLIQTKLTAPTRCQNSHGFFYQISHQWLSQYSLRFKNHHDKKDLL
ncbi:uncharacterized protein si:dkey-229e3.2 isoform X2 [Silurus meridionalis]|uniref:uncharacterized protein si:dkey-229e3.2 isoform X2 n=1 Tax=Silurus meridionalis TaxID=175797 RepID=UPI001EEAFCCD|nr:uncharacterized protein si:dkey-229e3.2 isoform X2 [Silurus meridionalis]